MNNQNNFYKKIDAYDGIVVEAKYSDIENGIIAKVYSKENNSVIKTHSFAPWYMNNIADIENQCYVMAKYFSEHSI